MKRILFLLLLFSAFANGQFIINSYAYAAGCINVYTEGNAINDCNEENDVTGIVRDAATSVGTGTVTSTSSFTDGGLYSARFLHTGTADQQLNYKIDFPVTNTTAYTITVRVWRAAGSNNWFLVVDAGDGWVATASDRVTGPGTGFYETLTVSGTADITGTAKITWNGTTGADGGDDNYWAYMTITSP